MLRQERYWNMQRAVMDRWTRQDCEEGMSEEYNNPERYLVRERGLVGPG